MGVGKSIMVTVNNQAALRQIVKMFSFQLAKSKLIILYAVEKRLEQPTGNRVVFKTSS